MPSTIHETPLVAPLLRFCARGLLRLLGWKIEGVLAPAARRCVVVAAPHTSNWDFPYMLLASFALGMHVRWLGKASLFRAPFGGVMRWLGGIAVHRERANNLVQDSAQALRDAPGALQLVIAPEGTRSHSVQWKTGFHHIARLAGLPIQLSYLDYGQRRCGLGPLITPGLDVDADVRAIRAFYRPIQGRNPDQFDAQ
jgi:1-acyl-sn-glycerol-3-phosphate acyltransferase